MLWKKMLPNSTNLFWVGLLCKTIIMENNNIAERALYENELKAHLAKHIRLPQLTLVKKMIMYTLIMSIITQQLIRGGTYFT